MDMGEQKPVVSDSTEGDFPHSALSDNEHSAPVTVSENQSSPSETDAGIVYVLENPAMPGYVKIGKTDNLDQRMRQLFGSSAVPVPFTCYHAGRVRNPGEVEKSLHQIFGDKRAHPRREFFEIDDPNRVAVAIKMVQISDVTPTADTDASTEHEDTESIRRATQRAERKENFNFAMVGIAANSDLQFVDNDSVTCTVVSQKPPRVVYKNEEMSLSNAATKAKGSKYAIQGSLYWKYNGETLQALREKVEAEYDET